MIEFNENILGIVISDIHLGNEFSRTQEIEVFLSNLLQSKNSGELPFFKILVVLGDFFDLNATDYGDLCENREYFRVYNLLEELRNKCVKIVFILGNHEIDTTGLYNLQFNARKHEFLENFKNHGFMFNFLEDCNMCQYLVMSGGPQNKVFLLLYGSKWKEPFHTIPISEQLFVNGSNYLMVHGFQFEHKFVHHIVSPIWEWVKTSEYNFKKKVSLAWQGIKSVLSYDQNPGEKNARYYDNIVYFLKKNNYPFTHVIFGHTHESEKFELNGLKIMNSGCWMTEKVPSYIEIYANGSSEEFNLNFDGG